MKKKIMRVVSVLLFAALMLSACSGGTQPAGGGAATTADTEATQEAPAGTTAEAPAEATDAEGASADTPLVFAESEFNEKFSPFFAESAYDMNVNRVSPCRFCQATARVP
ncbi:MAG: hypothetical protein II868_01210 [Butyrivibrio sp.]|nr:hypothetical protein [Butyrivibrio sp.]